MKQGGEHEDGSSRCEFFRIKAAEFPLPGTESISRLSTNKGPESIVKAFEGIGRTWETRAFEVRDVK